MRRVDRRGSDFNGLGAKLCNFWREPRERGGAPRAGVAQGRPAGSSAVSTASADSRPPASSALTRD